MWYLSQNTLVVMIAFVGLIAIFRLFTKNKIIPYLMPILNLLCIGYISKELLTFTIIYFFIGYIGNKLIEKFHSKWTFLFVTLLSFLPFLFSRAESFNISLPFVLITIGVAYNLLRIIDGFYYVYYARDPISFLPYINYIFFLPVFTAGPIFRYRDFLSQFENPRGLDIDTFVWSIKRIIKGFFKKLVLVVFCMDAFKFLIEHISHWYISIAIMVLAYLIMYMDLSGYSDIAIGFGSIAGYKIPENFKKPWNAATISQFWRSWHATMSDWIREHVFILIGRRQLSKFQAACVSIIVMLLMSLWHGFEMSYIYMGMYNGILLGIENVLGLTTFNKRKSTWIEYRFRTLVVSFLFTINTMIFLMPIDKILEVLKGFLKF